MPVFAGLLAVLPAAFALWSGRRIAAFADDPAIAERLLANRTRGGVLTGFCGAILVTTAVHQLAWALPLLIVARIAAGYPLRKELDRESWSLAAYLFFFVRLVFAVFGYSLLLAMTPSLVRLAGSRDWIVAGVLAVVLLIWNEAYVAVFRVVLRARPLDDGVLVGRFTRMLKDCGLPAVSLEQVDMRGGVYANVPRLCRAEAGRHCRTTGTPGSDRSAATGRTGRWRSRGTRRRVHARRRRGSAGRAPRTTHPCRSHRLVQSVRGRGRR